MDASVNSMQFRLLLFVQACVLQYTVVMAPSMVTPSPIITLGGEFMWIYFHDNFGIKKNIYYYCTFPPPTFYFFLFITIQSKLQVYRNNTLLTKILKEHGE
jgi:hypothetical protein